MEPFCTLCLQTIFVEGKRWGEVDFFWWEDVFVSPTCPLSYFLFRYMVLMHYWLPDLIGDQGVSVKLGVFTRL